MSEKQKLPEHERIYRKISEMILFGVFVPGQAVTIQGLVDQLGAGMTPVREALRRLTAEGALKAKGNRRIEVPVLGLGELEELHYARLSIEPKLAQIAAERRMPGLPEALRAIDDLLNEAIRNGDVEGYLKHNHRFHFTLYRGAGADILLALTQSLWLRIGPSLRVVCGRYGTLNLPDKHDVAISAIAEGDGNRAAQAIDEDLRQGMDQIRQSLIFADKPVVD